MTLEDQITQITGKRVQKLTSLSGGMIGTVFQVHLTNGNSIVAKVMSGDHATLDIEAYMLRYLADHSNLPVPELIHNSKNLLLMSFIEGDSHLSPEVQAHAADLLATLHNISAPHFGLERDTLIGGLHQPNHQSNSWIDFFREQRLIHMGRKALEEHKLSQKLMDRLEKFSADLPRWLSEPGQPSLIHGDMWTTNILAHNGQISGFVDPAIYYADPEIELAFSTLFGTFGQPFFNRYKEIRPLEPDFMEVRRDIYNLYPLLVHVRLFGGGYVRSVEQTLGRFGY